MGLWAKKMGYSMGYHMFTASFPLTAADQCHELPMACHLGRQFVQRRQERSHDPAAFLKRVTVRISA